MKLKSFQARSGTALSSIVPMSLHCPKPWMCRCCHRNEKKTRQHGKAPRRLVPSNRNPNVWVVGSTRVYTNGYRHERVPISAVKTSIAERFRCPTTRDIRCFRRNEGNSFMIASHGSTTVSIFLRREVFYMPTAHLWPTRSSSPTVPRAWHQHGTPPTQCQTWRG